MDQCDFMDPFDEELAAVFGQGFQNYMSPEINSLSSPTVINILSSNSINSLFTFPSITPTKQHKPINYHSKFPRVHGVINPDQPSSAPIVLNFGNANPLESLQQVSLGDLIIKSYPLPLNHEDEDVISEVLRSQGSYNINSVNATRRSQPTNKKRRTRPPSQTYDHIVAERRRREQLSQLFIALSAIVPGLKKTDKTSILGDAIKYLKHLQQRVEILEEKAAKQTMDPLVLVKKSQIFVEDEGSSDEKSGSSDEQVQAPEIEARVVNNNILLRIHCGKQKGVLANLLSKVESLNMVVVNTNVTPFGSSALDITIIAEMEKEFSLTVKEVATALRAALQPAAP
ncbi:hypothetical protein Pfo_008532 [Paulownia fortunei]|nr:hypothetical protein Pfo_008532 [Paulownia fortunei]